MAKSPSKRVALPSDPKERFIVVAKRRSANAVNAINSLQSVVSKEYTYTDDQAAKLVGYLRNSVDELETVLKNRVKNVSKALDL